MEENRSKRSLRSSRKSQPFIVGAIDFGTSNSGWACSLLNDFEKEPTKSFVPRWISRQGLITLKAPTCVLIAKEDETLVAFGYDAENRFIDLVEKGDEGKYYFFREFKMALNKKVEQVFNRNLTIEDTVGEMLPAMKVFSLTIAYLVSDLISKMNLGVIGGIDKNDVQWVLTVPAIWTDSSKQFMTEAALEAGIPEDKLTIALEPEVASLYCQYLPLDISFGKGQARESRFQIGTRYLVLDAGGGTVDVTIHEIDQNGGLNEIYAASGGGWGGTMVNQAFDDFMRELVGKEVYDTFLKEEVEDQFDFRRDVEQKKLSISQNTESITMKFPASLTEIYLEFASGKRKIDPPNAKSKETVELHETPGNINSGIANKKDETKSYQEYASGERRSNSLNTKSEETGEPPENEDVEDQLHYRRDVKQIFFSILPKKELYFALKSTASQAFSKMVSKEFWKDVFSKEDETKPLDIKDHIKASKYGDQIEFRLDKFRIHPSLMKGFFSESIEKILDHVKSLLQHVKNVTAILMVGGYSESPMLQDAMKSSFPDLHVIIPRESASAVLRGAVLFGFVPDSIKCRVLKYTYGYEGSSTFIEGIHPEENKITNDHGVYCSNCFVVYVRRHQTVKLGEEPLVISLKPQYSTQKSINISIYATRSKPPVVVNQSLTKIGELDIDLEDHDGDINREISFSMSFDNTTIKARAKDEKTGKYVKAYLNFLG